MLKANSWGSLKTMRSAPNQCSIFDFLSFFSAVSMPRRVDFSKNLTGMEGRNCTTNLWAEYQCVNGESLKRGWWNKVWSKKERKKRNIGKKSKGDKIVAWNQYMSLWRLHFEQEKQIWKDYSKADPATLSLEFECRRLRRNVELSSIHVQLEAKMC